MTDENILGSLPICTEKQYRGIRLFCYDLTDSTNTRAKEFHKSEGASRTPAIFISRAQTAGRGTRGRSFESPADSGIYISFLFYPDIAAADSAKITTYAATRVIRAIDRFVGEKSSKPMIKWVNDIYIENKKISGILTEGEAGDDGILSYAIIGIGINLKRGALSEQLSDIAASLEDFGIDIEGEELFAALTDEIFSEIDNLCAESTMNEYRNRSMLIGRDIIMSTYSEKEKIKVTDISDDGALVGINECGEVKKYLSGDARVIFK